MDGRRIPIACSLSADDAAAQAREWISIGDLAIGREVLPNGMALTLPLGVADDIEDLAAREADCCAFLKITTRRDEESITVSVTSDDPAAQPIIDLLIGVGA